MMPWQQLVVQLGAQAGEHPWNAAQVGGDGFTIGGG